jgi:hypothetical protein
LGNGPARETERGCFSGLRSPAQPQKVLRGHNGFGIQNHLTPTMNYLTKGQQKVLCVILVLLLTGLAVKTWRIAHPPTKAVAEESSPRSR